MCSREIWRKLVKSRLRTSDKINFLDTFYAYQLEYDPVNYEPSEDYNQEKG